MTYSDYVEEMKNKFPNHQPMSEFNFNLMERSKEASHSKSAPKPSKKAVQLTLENHAKNETVTKPSYKSSKRKSA